MRARGVAAAALVGLVALGGLGAAPPDTSSLLVLGDSYASGEGLSSATGVCGTELVRSWGALLAAERGAGLENLACSGAEVPDITTGGPQQLPAQRAAAADVAPVPLAAVTIGGNDLGFVDIVADCLGFAAIDGPPRDPATAGAWRMLVDGGTRDGGCDVSQSELLERVDGLAAADAFAVSDGASGGLAAVYASIVEDVVADDGLLVVLGYPSLFAPPDQWAPRYGRRCHGLRAQDAAELTDVVGALDAVIADEVAAANATLGREQVLHVSLLEPWAEGGHHGLCGAGEPWVNGLTVVEGGVDIPSLVGQLGAAGGLDLEALGARPGGSFHPNTAGHAAIAAIIADALPEES